MMGLFPNLRKLNGRNNAETCYLISSKKFCLNHLRQMTKRNEQKVMQLHQSKHGVKEMVSCLDCMYVKWENYLYLVFPKYGEKKIGPILFVGASCQKYVLLVEK